MNKSDSINELATALAKAQGEIKGAELDATNPHFKSPYSTLSSVWEACRAPLSKNGLSIIQTLEKIDGSNVLETTLLHSSGQYFSGHCPLLLTKQDMQGLGSAYTYAKRYAICALIGVASIEDDDDANEADYKPSYTPPQTQTAKPTLNKSATPSPVSPIKAAQAPIAKDKIMAAENDIKAIWALIKTELSLTDEAAKTFCMKVLPDKKSSKEWTMADVEKLTFAVEKLTFAVDIERDQQSLDHYWANRSHPKANETFEDFQGLLK